ncbi:RidA family protein [Mariniluteicoccus flavus]
MTASEKLAELGIELPAVARPVAAYIPATRVGNQVWTSGQVPFVNGELQITGKVGAEVTPEQAAQQARICALNGLAAIAAECGGIDRITRIVKMVIFVASAPDFTGQPAVGNGASELVAEVFGEAGAHVRSAVGVAALPMNCCVEVEMVAEVA